MGVSGLNASLECRTQTPHWREYELAPCTRGSASCHKLVAVCNAPNGSSGDKPLLIDTFPYNGEPIVELRLKYLAPAVDMFLVVEAWHTYSGSKKDFLYIERHAPVFAQYGNKVRFVVITKFPPPSASWLEKHAEPWMVPEAPAAWFREAYQSSVPGNFLQKSLPGEEYIVFASDADEIPRREVVEAMSQHYTALASPLYLAMDFFYYNFQWRKKMLWHQAFAVNDAGLQEPISRYRAAPKPNVVQNAGWHASYFLDYADLQRKLNSFSHLEFNATRWRMTEEYVTECIRNGKDILARGEMEDMVQVATDNLPPLFQQFQKKIVSMQQI